MISFSYFYYLVRFYFYFLVEEVNLKILINKLNMDFRNFFKFGEFNFWSDVDFVFFLFLNVLNIVEKLGYV